MIFMMYRTFYYFSVCCNELQKTHLKKKNCLSSELLLDGPQLSFKVSKKKKKKNLNLP